MKAAKKKKLNEFDLSENCKVMNAKLIESITVSFLKKTNAPSTLDVYLMYNTIKISDYNDLETLINWKKKTIQPLASIQTSF